MIDDPRKLSIPDDPIERIHALARDIAYTSIMMECTAHLSVKKDIDEAIIVDDGLNKALRNKWENKHNYYMVHLLVSFGYLVRSNAPTPYSDTALYDITPKAFALLERPYSPSSVFISYKHDQSSAFALLVEARLKLISREIGVFIDKSIPLGDLWHSHLEETVKASKFFICLLGKNTLASPFVRKEIDWAWNKATIIAICHNGYSLPYEKTSEDDSQWGYIEKLKSIQNFKVNENENAEEYEHALAKLMNRLGYSTY